MSICFFFFFQVAGRQLEDASKFNQRSNNRVPTLKYNCVCSCVQDIRGHCASYSILEFRVMVMMRFLFCSLCYLVFPPHPVTTVVHLVLWTPLPWTVWLTRLPMSPRSSWTLPLWTHCCLGPEPPAIVPRCIGPWSEMTKFTFLACTSLLKYITG
jgi:hypothetical protein